MHSVCGRRSSSLAGDATHATHTLQVAFVKKSCLAREIESERKRVECMDMDFHACADKKRNYARPTRKNQPCRRRWFTLCCYRHLIPSKRKNTLQLCGLCAAFERSRRGKTFGKTHLG